MSNKTQQSLEKHLEQFPPIDLEAEATYEELFGPIEDWIVQLEGHQILLDPVLKQWFIYRRSHDEWQRTGIGPGQAEFVIVGHMLGIRKPSHEEVPEAATVMRPSTSYALEINQPEYPDPVLITGPVTIGRSKKNDIMLADEKASRQHARLHWDGTILMVEDLGSTNPTEVNSVEISSLTVLKPGDTITIGDTNIKIITTNQEENS